MVREDKMTKLYIKLLCISLILVALTGCSKNNLNLFDMESIDLTGKKYAMIFSADIWTQLQKHTGRNVLLLIDDEGNWDAYYTYNLDRANVNWTEDGLYFSDYRYDYFIDQSGFISKVENIKDGTAQYGSSIDEAGGVWSWYDIGFYDDGYETQVNYQYKNTSKKTIIEGVYSYFFTVNTQLYGVSSSYGLENGINNAGQLGLVRFDGDELTPNVMSAHPLPSYDLEPVDISQQVAIKDNIVYVIGKGEVIEGKTQTNLMMWNLDDGHFEIEWIAPLTDHSSGELGYYSFYTHQDALQDDSLYWFNERGELNETNLKTFETEMVSTYGIDITEDLYFSARFLGDDIYMVVNDTTWGRSFESDGVKMRIIESSLVDPINYSEFKIVDGESLSKLF